VIPATQACVLYNRTVKTLLAEADRQEILRRVELVRADSARQWGRMTAPQMICHLNDAFRAALGEKSVSSGTNSMKRTLIKHWALWVPLPWPKGFKTRPEVDAEHGGTRPRQFAADVEDFRTFLNRYCALKEFPPHPLFGPMNLRERMRWAYLHIDHHFRQFGV
jgi:hypothetical protein